MVSCTTHTSFGLIVQGSCKKKCKMVKTAVLDQIIALYVPYSASDTGPQQRLSKERKRNRTILVWSFPWYILPVLSNQHRDLLVWRLSPDHHVQELPIDKSAMTFSNTYLNEFILLLIKQLPFLFKLLCNWRSWSSQLSYKKQPISISC